jgi:hypothetical protein
MHFSFCFCINPTVFTLFSVRQTPNHLHLRAGRLDGEALLLLPVIPSDNRKQKIDENKHTQKRDYRTSVLHRLGGNFPTSVVARKSNTALSHFCMENSSETCTCRHLPTFQPHRCPERSLLVFPSAAVAEEVFPCLGRFTSTAIPPALIIVQVSEPFQVRAY